MYLWKFICLRWQRRWPHFKNRTSAQQMEIRFHEGFSRGRPRPLSTRLVKRAPKLKDDYVEYKITHIRTFWILQELKLRRHRVDRVVENAKQFSNKNIPFHGQWTHHAKDTGHRQIQNELPRRQGSGSGVVTVASVCLIIVPLWSTHTPSTSRWCLWWDTVSINDHFEL